MATDSKQTNPTGPAADTSQQDWLELDQQGPGGEALKAKKWSAKSRLVDNSQHIGNIHTGTEKTVELDKSDTLTGDLPQEQPRQDDQPTEELNAAILTPETSAAKPTTAFYTQQHNQEAIKNQEPWVQGNEQSSAAQHSGSGPLVFEEHFEDPPALHSPEEESISSPLTQQNTVSRKTVETPREQILKPESTAPEAASPTPPPPSVEDDSEEIITIESSASAPILNAKNSYGVEDNAVAINISSRLTDTDGSETLAITIEGVPKGASLSAGTNLGNGTWQLTAAELTDLALFPPTDSDQNFSLTITATSTEHNGGKTSSLSEVIDVFMEAVNDAPEITGNETINISEDSMEGFSGYGATWEGNIYSIVTQEEMLEHLGITDVDSNAFTVSLANATDKTWHGGLQANDSSFSSDTLLSDSANGDETVIQITQEFLNNYPTVDAQVGDFYFDHVDFDKLSEGETAGIGFSVVVSDGEALSEPQNFAIQITGSNDAPIVSGSVILPEGTEDTSQSFTPEDLLANTTDIDTDTTLSVTNVSVDPAQGTLTTNPDGSFTFTPKGNYNGKVTINYEVSDGIEIVPATASLELAAANNAPIAVDDLAQNHQVQLSANNTSLIADSPIIQDNSNPYTVSIDITPEEQDYGYIISNGGQTRAASGFFVTRGVYGKDSSVYQIGVADENQFIVFQGGQVENGQQSNLTFSYDGQKLTVYQNGVDITDTGTISVRPGRDLPMQNVTLGAPSNIPTSYEFKGAADNVQIYDSSLNASDVAQIQNGEIPRPDSLLAHYSFEGDSPLADQSGNGHDLQAHGDIQFSESAAATLSTNEDTDLTISAESLLANDTDIDGDTLSITAVSKEVTDSNGVVVGTATQDNDGNIVFSPGDALDSMAAGENKDVNFTYTVSDGHGGTDTATVSVTITGTNDAPVLHDDTGVIQENDINPLTGNILSNDSDVDKGSNLSISNISGITVFQDNFNNDNANNWTEISYNGVDTGNWQVDGGVIGERSNSAKGIIAHEMGENADSTNYEISVDIHANTGNTYNNNVGVTFGYQDTDNYYMVKWDDYSESYSTFSSHKDFKLIKVENGQETTIAQIDHAELPSDFNLSLAVSESNGISVTVDGEELLTAPDEHPAINTIGLNTDDNDGGISYDNVLVINNAIPIEDETSIAGTYGTLTLNADGNYSYTLDNTNRDVQALHDGEQLTESFSVNVQENQSGDTGSEVLNITINGTNDQPVAHDDSTVTTLQTVFTDTFTDDNSDNWTEISYNGVDTGNWQVEGGVIGERSNSAKGIIAHEMGENADSTNYEISVDIHANTGNTYNNNVGVTFGYQDTDNYYMVKWDDYSESYSTFSSHKDFKLIKVENGQETTIAQIDHAELPSDFNLSLAVSESNGISVTVDGEELLTAPDEHPAINTIGLNTDDNDGGISYDNVSIQVASEQTITSTEDATLTINAKSLLANDTDVDDDVLAISAVAEEVTDSDGNVVGTATQDDEGNILFTPGDSLNSLAEGEQKKVNFTYTVSDEQGSTDTANVTVVIVGTNDAPVITEASDGHIELSDTSSSNITIADSESINLNGSEDFSISLAVTPEGEQGKYDIIFNKENAVELAYNTDGNLQFAMRTEDESWTWHQTDVPYEADATNNITFSYDGENVTISNTNENGETSTFSQSYTGGIIDTYSNNDLMIGNRPFGGGLYSSDGEVDDISMTVNGEEVVSLNFDGSDALTDKSGYGNDATLGADTNLTQKNSLGTIQEDQPVKFSAEALLEGVTDVDGDTLHILEVHVDDAYGSMEYGQDADGNIESFTFVPNENFNGEDVPISFTVSDGQSKTEGKALIDVTAVNDAPVIESSIDLGTINEDTAIEFKASDLLTNATDVDGDQLSILDVSVDKAFGSIEYSTDPEGNIETIKFTPNENFNGEDVPIKFVATDGQVKVEGNAAIDVNAVNDAPVIQSGDGHIELSDTSSSNITIADSESINLNGSEDFSISLAVTPEGEQGKYDIIFNKENAVELAYNTDGNLQFAMRTEDESWTWHQTDVPYETDATNNITFSYDGENVTISNTNENGETSTFSQSYTGGIIDTYSNNNLMIGNRPFGGGRYSSDGEVDDISMTVNGEEVLSLQFDGNDTLTDTSGYGNDATLGENANLIQGDSYSLDSIQEDQPVTFSAETLLEGVQDADGDKLSILDVSVDEQYGTVAFNTDQEGNIDTITFTPNENFSGEEIPINYVVTDGQVNVEGTTDITITAVADAPLLQLDIGEATSNTTTVIDIDAAEKEGMVLGDDGNYYITETREVSTQVETEKIMKTEEISVEKADTIRMDEKPDYGLVEIQDADGNWSEMLTGKEYSADSEVRFIPDSDKITAESKDIQIGTFGENTGSKDFSEEADVSDWGELSNDGKSVVFTEGDLTVSTSSNDGALAAYNSSGEHIGAGIGDNDNSGLSENETLTVSLEGEEVHEVSFTLDGLGDYFEESSSHATEVSITAYDADGNTIETQSGYRDSGQYSNEYSFTSDTPIASFEIGTSGSDGNFVVQNMTITQSPPDDISFTATYPGGTEITLNSELNITSENLDQTFDLSQQIPSSNQGVTQEIQVVDTEAMAAKGASLVDGIWVVEQTETQEFQVEVDPPTKTEIDSYTYQLDIKASLTDSDGSESLSDVTVDIPKEVTTVTDSDGNTLVINDGTVQVPVTAGQSTAITLITENELSGEQLGSLQAQVTATEETTGTTNTTITGGSGDDIILGGETTDTVSFSGNEADYNIVKNSDGSFTVQDTQEGRDGDDTVSGVEHFQFADTTVDAGDLTLSSKLIDGAVEGVEYSTSSGLHGFTDQDGGFAFKDGDDVTFSVGGVTLGVATAEDVATGQTFLQDVADVDRTDLNDEYLENMATFLQSIDENSNAYDGIVVTDEIREALANADIDLRTASEDDVQDLVEQLGKAYVEEDAAMEHVEDMLVEYTDLEHDSFDEHTDDRSTDLDQALGGDLEKLSDNTVISATAVTAASSTDAVIQNFNETDSADLSLNVPSLTLPGDEEELQDSDIYEAVSATDGTEETAVQNQNEPVNEMESETLQQTNTLADDDLSTSLPPSLSTLFDEPGSDASEESEQIETEDNSPSNTANSVEQTTAQPVENTEQTSSTNTQPPTTVSEDDLSTDSVTVQEEQVTDDAESTEEEAELSTDSLSITLDPETDDDIQATEQPTDDSLDRFVADGNVEQGESNDFDQFSANDETAAIHDMSSVDVLDTPEAENIEQVEDAGLSVDDGIQEELPQEIEQIETNIG